MRFCVAFMAAALFTAPAADSASAQRAAPAFSSATAFKMVQACVAYARAHNGAVNISIYNDRGELLHFQRMDGAPLQGPSFSSGPQYGGDPFLNGPGPVVAIPDTSPVDAVPVVIDGVTVGSAQAVGMGEEGDRACAKAAADAAQTGPKRQGLPLSDRPDTGHLTALESRLHSRSIMSSAAYTISDTSGAHEPSLDMEALEGAAVQTQPFPFLIVPGFVRSVALPGIGRDFPAINHHGSFPLSTLRYGAAFAAFVEELSSPRMTAVVARKLGIDLSSAPTMVTVRGQSRAADGKIHTDSRTKLVTALIYMNDSWESPRGRLRLVRSEHDLDDVIAEVPPEQGTLLLFRNDANAWHGFEPFSGPRRVIQLNWVTSASVVRREQFRHRISALFKRLKRPA